jgi:FKBP-type peptidyl-prolyl cis-trans isomerase SlyD
MENIEDMSVEPEMVSDNLVVSLDYTLTVDGAVLDSSEDSGPIEFIQGRGEIIQGLEDGITGMRLNENREVIVEPVNGYGEIDPEAVVDVPTEDFPEGIPLEVGIQLQVSDDNGQMMDATILEVNEDVVKLDFNHPLAGKQLVFNVTITGLRDATQEELDHGHVYEDCDCEDCEDCEEEEEDVE